MRCFTLSLSMILLLAPAVRAGEVDHSFDGVWKIALLPDPDATKAGKQRIEDTLTFDGEKAKSDYFTSKGFSELKVRMSAGTKNSKRFDATQKHPDEGTLEWTGFTRDSKLLNGTVSWTKTDGTTLKFKLRGSRL